MPEMTLTISGFDQLRARLTSGVQDAKDEAIRELYIFAEEVMSASKEIVPVDTGALMNTGHVQLPVIEGERATVTLGYGDESVGYALIVHENMDPRVHWHRPGSGPKYLESPLHERQDSLPGRVLDAYRRGLGSA